jgi:cytochrome c-type biogenesis protein CcmH/NrfG
VKRQLIVSNVVCVLVGFIVGFFVNQAMKGPATPFTEQSSDTLPEDHPPPELLARLGELIERVENHPEDLDSLVELGNSFYDMGRFDAAIQWYERALQLDPDIIEVSTDLGTSYLYTGNSEAAVERFKASLEMDNDHPQTLQNLGVAFFSTGQYKEAVDVWQRLVDTHPDYERAADIREQIKTAELHMRQQTAAP